MKSTMLTALLITTLLQFSPSLTVYAQTSCAQLDGVWEYDLSDRRGLSFIKNDRFLLLHVPKERKTFSSEDPTPKEKAAAFDGLSAYTGTLKCENDRLSLTPLYCHDPAQAGLLFTYDIKIENGKFKFRTIQNDGKPGPERNAHKIADFPDTRREFCGTADGFWEYELPDQYGIAALANGYFGWIVVDKTFWDAQPSLESIEDKAQAFEKLIVAVGTYSCDDQDRSVWKNIHAKSYRIEGKSFTTENKKTGNIFQFWYLNAEGNRNGGGGKAVRLK